MLDKNLVHTLYYQPKGAWVGDIMPYGKNGTFYLYDQRDDRREGPITAPFGWSLATTKDFVHYTDCSDSIKKGTDNDRDQFIYAGSVFEAKGKVHAFYTGHNRIWQNQGKTSEVLLHAYSDDFKTWVKSDKLAALVPQKGYDNGNSSDWPCRLFHFHKLGRLGISWRLLGF
jgi:beta-fructofuranosidase